ncbi:MAG TPA: single-stranded-DNA-specific exonuclease RecJ [Bryobacteraceae bacterium]|jgi:single-stranded-DNA-specific exonuclease
MTAPSAATTRRTNRVPPHWNLPPPIDSAALRELARSLALRTPAARVLWNRGFRDPASSRDFLSPSLELLHDPMLMSGMPRAVERLSRAIRNREKILIYGDYDVDGTTSIVILKKAIELSGGEADYHVPHRLREGYGMRPEVLADAVLRGVKLVVSVDTGIRAAEVVRAATALGLDMIITDHHLPDADVPPAVAVLNPNQPGCPYPEKNLCGAGVTFKLIQALLARLEWPPAKSRRLLESFLKLVAIATVADVVPLTGENRLIVKTGLAGLSDVRNTGLRALLDVAGFESGKPLSASQVAFRVAPRINAAGRMANAGDVIEMFLTDDAAKARDLATQLHDLNADRQQTEKDIVEAILVQCDEFPVRENDFALVFSKPGWHRGVIGIVASRIVDRFHRPVFILGEEDGLAQGSGRSIRAFHLLEALESMPELFHKFGGHRQAAGLTMAASSVEEFRQRLNAHATSVLTPDQLRPVLDIDAEVGIEELNEGSVNETFTLAPFGFGNPAPVFALRDVEIAAPPMVIKDVHLRLKVKQGRRFLSVIAWQFAERISEFEVGNRVDLAVALEEDEYSASRGYENWSAKLRDSRPSEKSR